MHISEYLSEGRATRISSKLNSRDNRLDLINELQDAMLEALEPPTLIDVAGELSDHIICLAMVDDPQDVDHALAALKRGW